MLVTTTHIVLIVGYTIISIMNDNIYAGTFAESLFRVATAFVFFSAILDIFVAYMMWFVFDDDEIPISITDE